MVMMKERFMVLFYRKRQGLAWREVEVVVVEWRVRDRQAGGKEGDKVIIIIIMITKLVKGSSLVIGCSTSNSYLLNFGQVDHV